MMTTSRECEKQCCMRDAFSWSVVNKVISREIISIILMEIQCRICLTQSTSGLRSIFSSVDNENYAERIFYSTGVQITEDDRLPQTICAECCAAVSSACAIKKRALKSDAFLRNLEEVSKSQEVEQVEQPAEEKCTKNKRPCEDDYKCFICSAKFEKINEKDAHVKTDHLLDSRTCEICHRKKQTPLALESHLRFHRLGFRFLCQTCGKGFKFKNLLETHMRVEHLNQIRFHCDLCSYATKFKINLQRHLKSSHLKLKNFVCTYGECKAQYSTKVALNLHLYRIHQHTAPVQCGECNQGFTFDSELRVHQKHCTRGSAKKKKTRPQDAAVDIVDSGFRCRVCSSIFKSRAKFSVHFSHKHRKSNVCEICDKQLASSTSLLKHMQVKHYQIKKHQCSFCQKSFGHKHSLQAHVNNIHTGSKPYKCTLCNYATGDRSRISKHKKKVHANSL